MKKKIIAFLIKNNVSETDYNNFNFFFLKKFFFIKFIDISLLTFKKNYLNLKFINYKKIPNYKKIKNFNILNKVLSKVDFIFDLHQSFLSHKKILKNLDKSNFSNLKSITMINGQLPNFYNHNILNKINFLLTFIFYIIKYNKFLYLIKNIFKFLKNSFTLEKKLKKKYNFAYTYTLVDSDLSENIADNYLSNSKKIFIHYKDYEKHLFYKSIKKNYTNYAVFLDEAIFNHPDSYEFNIKNLNKINKNLIKLYFIDLCNFFNKFEKNTKIKIIIAGHPRSLKFNYAKFYENRKVIFNNTYELVRNSQLVFAHWSTSVNYAVILKKPIVFLNSKTMFNLGMFYNILSFALETGSRHICLDENYSDYKDFLKQDYTKYKYFFRKYIKSSKSRNISLWEEFNYQINKM